MLSFTALFAQETKTYTTQHKYSVHDTLKVDSLALKKSNLKILNSNKELLSVTDYLVNEKTGEIKQAATSMAARFLYMVVLYMAPEK